MNNITNITIAFCEGPHDTAFLYRILKTKCYEGFKDTLDQLPTIIGGFIKTKNKSLEYEKFKLDSLKNEYIPYKIMTKDKDMVLLYSMGGDKDFKDNDKNKRLVLLNHFFDNIKRKKEINKNARFMTSESSKNKSNFTYKFLFFYDADENKEEKLNIVNKYLSKIDIDEKLEHNQILKKDGFSIGAYIFSNENEKGALEDILFNLMKQDNETIFKQADIFYKKYLDEARLKRLSTECQDNIPNDKRKDKKQIDEKKSIIAIAGQLQNKGKSNVVTIEDSDYLNLDKIKNSQMLQEIAKFIINKEK